MKNIYFPFVLVVLLFTQCKEKKQSSLKQAVKTEQNQTPAVDTVKSPIEAFQKSGKTEETQNSKPVHAKNLEVYLDENYTKKENLRTETRTFDEGTVKKEVGLIYAGTDDEVTIIWEDDYHIATVNKPNSVWQARGIYCGMTLKELEALNQNAIEFYGFGWDYGGTVKLGNGKINKTGLSLSLTAPPFEHPSYKKLVGDNIFSSGELKDETKSLITVNEISISGLKEKKLEEWNCTDTSLSFDKSQAVTDSILNLLPIKGEIVHACQCFGMNDHNIIVLSQQTTVKENSEGPSAVSKTLTAKIFEAIGSDFKEVYTKEETTSDCYFQMDALFARDGILLSDVDEDGDYEISFAYQMGCSNELTEKPIKLITFEGGTEYIISGSTIADYGHMVLGGETNFSASYNFKHGPQGLLSLLKPLWGKYQKNNYQEF